ncbi:hypothetical protein PI23P_06680 [Polaribacter irgensii 23-P]|uniref:Gingipain domain-containing protein n=1 Tax=Polaribacter irgensii 23-P TaxID=313594 RepID=A4BYP5_9FLAO|nr:C25 family cysteine peptidase [Polaribacter irgensii]EAR12288.1 hypothetical protein PI23P_06680 [Polaribacter irgensii 23-P]
MAVNVNGSPLYVIPFGGVTDNKTKARTAVKSAFISNSAGAITVEIAVDNGGNPAANAYLDFIKIIGKNLLVCKNNQFYFRSFLQSEATTAVTYKIQNATNIFQIWEVSEFLTPKLISNEATDGNFVFTVKGGTLCEYVLLNMRDFYNLKIVENAKFMHQNLRTLKAINYLVVTTAELFAQAQKLADYRQNNSGLRSKVLLLKLIYNEFFWGSKDIIRTRDFIRHLCVADAVEAEKL